MTLTTDSPYKAELVVDGLAPMAFQRLDDAMEIGRELHRAGQDVHIEAIDEQQDEQRTGWRYEAGSDEWFKCQLPSQRW